MVQNSFRHAVILSVVLAMMISGLEAAVVNRIKDAAKGAVVTNGEQCASIGKSLLDQGGTAVDAAIGALICEGIVLPESMGIGGGFLMTIYKKETNKATFLIARERAPLRADRDMFHGNKTLAAKGILSGAVPGELKGYHEAYKRFGGGVPWAKIIEPSIKLCKEGIPVTPYVAHVLEKESAQINNDVGLKRAYTNAATGKTLQPGEKHFRPLLAQTLEELAKDGNSFYNGTLADKFIEEVRDLGGIITKEDLQNYTVEWRDPVSVPLPGGRTLYTATFPGSGVLLSYMLNILKGLVLDRNPEDVVTYHRIVEAFKFGYGKRTEFGDLDFLPDEYKQLANQLLTDEYAAETRTKIFDTTTSQDPKYYGAEVALPDDYGTANLNVLAPNGDAVAVTSTIDTYFGSGILLPKTGIILNDEMDDFSSPNVTNEYGVPPSKNNFIERRKRPLSSMSPSIVVKDNDVELVVGAAGGTKITTSVTQTIIRHLWYNMSIYDAIQAKRFHHQLLPMQLVLEPGFNQTSTRYLLDGLKAIGHNVTVFDAEGFSAVTGISKRNGVVEGSYDERRQGEVAYVY